MVEFISNPAYVLSILCLNIILSEWLVKNTFFRYFGTALLVIVITSVVANLGLIPSSSNSIPLYDGIFGYLAPIAIFYLLLDINLKNLKQAGIPMLIMFFIGSLGTVAGVLIGLWVVDGENTIGELYYALGGMFTATYTGGSLNFNALALHYEITKEPTLYAGAVAVDNIMTSLWMILCILIPSMLNRFVNRESRPVKPSKVADVANYESERISIRDLSILLFAGPMVLFISFSVAEMLDHKIPSILILTTIALILAQFQFVNQLKGKQVLGLFAVYLFLAVIGAYAELATLGNLGSLAIYLTLFVVILFTVHGIIVFGIGGLLKLDWVLIAVASQANIGGQASALALAKSLGKNDLLLPAILVGTLGNGIGTYLGFLIAGFLQT